MSELFTKGSWIAYSDVEDGEKYTIRGEVSKFDKKKGQVHLKAEAPYGDVVFSVDEASKMKAIKKPSNVKKFKSPKTRQMSSKASVVELSNGGFKPNSPVASKKARVTGGPSKKDRAIELYDASKSRQENIELFVKELNMTPAGASTYVAMAKKANS